MLEQKLIFKLFIVSYVNTISLGKLYFQDTISYDVDGRMLKRDYHSLPESKCTHLAAI